MIDVPLGLIAQLVGLVFLLFFLRGAYLIYKSETSEKEKVREAVAEREGREYEHEHQRAITIVNEAEGRVCLLRRRFWNAVDRLRWWRS